MLKILAYALVFSLIPANAFAQEGTPASEDTGLATASQPLQERAADALALLQGEADAKDVLGARFLASVPPAQFAAITQQLTSQFGAPIGIKSLEPTGEFTANIAIRFERAIGRGTMALSPDAPHKIEGLLLRQFEPIDDSLAKIEADLLALPGKVSAYFGPVDGNNPALSINAGERFAIGSTFKLYVLAALGNDIKAGQRRWDDTVPLTAKSFPSGMMQDWPSGSPITLHSLASMMISISDNTATDQLMAVLGRERIEQTVAESGFADPAKTMPFLTTREMFALKSGPVERLQAYRSQTNTRGMREILEGLDTSGLTTEQINAAFSGKPVALDVEWFASANDLRRLFEYMNAHSQDSAFDIMSINQSVPANLREQWAFVGYKGGSEPGVLNLTWFLTDHSGNDYVLTLSWNNPDASLENSALELIAQRILSLPR